MIHKNGQVWTRMVPGRDRRGDPCLLFFEGDHVTVVAYHAPNNAAGMNKAIEALARALETLKQTKDANNDIHPRTSTEGD